MQIESENPKELIEAAKKGELKAFRRLFSMYLIPVFRYIDLRVRDSEGVENLTIDVFLRAYQALCDFEVKSASPVANFFTIARNSIIEYWRKHRDQVSFGKEDILLQVPVYAKGEIPAPKKDMAILLYGTMNELRGDERDVVTLRCWSGVGTREVAKYLGKSEEAVRDLQMRGILALWKNLAEKTDEEVKSAEKSVEKALRVKEDGGSIEEIFKSAEGDKNILEEIFGILDWIAEEKKKIQPKEQLLQAILEKIQPPSSPLPKAVSVAVPEVIAPKSAPIPAPKTKIFWKDRKILIGAGTVVFLLALIFILGKIRTSAPDIAAKEIVGEEVLLIPATGSVVDAMASFRKEALDEANAVSDDEALQKIGVLPFPEPSSGTNVVNLENEI